VIADVDQDGCDAAGGVKTQIGALTSAQRPDERLARMKGSIGDDFDLHRARQVGGRGGLFGAANDKGGQQRNGSGISAG
jgi:dihydrodipicolinate synthase/N-acetylneuraminate lyase